MTQAREKALLDSVVVQLRVPDLKYALGDEPPQILSQEQESALRIRWEDSEKSTLIRLFDESAAFAPNILNTAFFVDRIFDVWMRKNNLHEELNGALGQARLDVFLLLHKAKSKSTRLKKVSQLFDAIAELALGWMPHPQRSKTLYLEGIGAALAQLQRDIDASSVQWQQFATTQSQKLEKVRSRLVVTEETKAQLRFAHCRAVHYTNRLIHQRTFSDRVARFIEQHYVALLSHAYLQAEPDDVERIEELLKKFIAVFCVKGNAAFKFADSLLDEVSAACEQYGVSVDATERESLENDMVRILQKQNVEESQQCAITCDDPLLDAGQALTDCNTWYVTEDGIRQHATAVFEATHQVLFTNYLGMKITVLTRNELAHAEQTRTIKPLKCESSFSDVCASAVSGLSKIAETQKKARVAAAEKAKQEAERLLEERRVADEEAKNRADEIARRTKEIKLKQAEKKRLEQEQLLRDTLSKLQLGAWIAVVNDESGKKDRYKLAVKFSARRKFLFVDKLGIRKLEFDEDSLIQSIIAGKVEILSDGAEFEDSLERVVSRIRMAK